MDIEILEEVLAEYKSISNRINELESLKKKIGQDLLKKFPEGVAKIETPRFKVSRQQRFSVKTTLDEARQYGAIKMEERVDKEKITALHKSGQSVPGVSFSEFVMVREVSTK